ncbi:PH domain-containing protein, partial [Shewanella sp. 0m-11]
MTHKFSQWSSLSAWSIISFTLLAIKQLLSSGYAIIPVVYTGWQKGFSSHWVIIAIAGIISAIFIFSVLQWLKFRFKVTVDKLIIRHGIVFKKADELPFAKIQNVRLEQPLYFRPVGLYRIIVETAGSKNNEAELSALDYKDALALKKQLMAEHDAHGPQSEIAQVNDPSQSQHKSNQVNTLSRKSLKQLLLFGFYQNNAIWLAV